MVALPGGVTQGCVYRADEFVFTVHAHDPADQTMLATLLSDLQSTDQACASAQQYSFERLNGGLRAWAIEGPRVDRYVTDDLTDAIGHLLAGINVATLDASPRSLHLHASAAAKDGQAVVIAAGRGTGKTTTVANLLARGYSFLTDETVILHRDRIVRGVPRPLSVKPGGWQHVPLSVDVMVPAEAGEGDFRFVPVGKSGIAVCPEARPCVVVLLRRSPIDRAEPAVETLHPADAVVSLMQETLDASRFGAEASLRLAEIAAVAHCARVTRGEPVRTAAVIDALLDEPVRTELVVHHYAPSNAIDPQVVSFAIDGRAVVHHVSSGRILALDRVATEVWETVGGWHHHAHVDLGGPVISAFVRQLHDHGLLASAGAA